MSGVFRGVLSLSLSGSLLAAALLLLRPLLGRRLSRRWRYYIWLVVIARLLLPLTLPVSGMGALPAPMEVPPAVAGGREPAAVLGEESGSGGGVPAETAGAARLTALWRGAGWVYLAGALLLLLRRVAEYRSFVRFLRAGGRPAEDPALLDRLSHWGEVLGVRRPVELWESAAVSTPLLLGVLRPCVVLPDLTLSEEDFRYTVCHELVHCRRWDVAVKWLAQLSLCVHWFNPLVWRVVRELDRTCELACDEAVTASLSAGERRAYGDTLLRAAGRGGRVPAAALTLGESGKLLKERLEAMMNDRNTVRMSGVMSVLLAIAIAAGAAAVGPGGGRPREPVSPGTAPQRGIVPNDVKGDPDAGYRYTQEVYTQPPYSFELAWNVSERAGERYPSRRVPLPSGEAVTVYYEEACGGVFEDGEELTALTALLDRLRERETEFPLKRALLLSVRYTGSADSLDLAERAYREGEVGAFAAAFGLLGEDSQRTFLDRCCGDSDVVLFAAAVSQLPKGSPLIGEFARRCYEDGPISFFSVLANGPMDREDAEAYLSRAEREDRANVRSVLYKALDRDGELEAMEAELDRQLAEEYRAHGVTVEGKNYYYRGQLVHIFLDRQPNQSFYRLNMNPMGSIDIKILRDEAGVIQGVAPLTAAEREELFGGGEPEEETIPVAFPSVEAGQTLWLGDYELDEGDWIRYDVAAETGDALQVGFARPMDTSLNTVYCSVRSVRQQGEPLRCTAEASFGPPAEPGTYRLFLRAPNGKLGGVQGSVAITYAD